MSANAFDDVELPGIGNLRTFAGQSVHTIKERIDPNTYGIYIAGQPAPQGWPAIAVAQDQFRLVRDGRCMTGISFSMCSDGRKWERFYACGGLEEKDDRPAFIYERRLLGEGVAYVPFVMMFVSPEGTVQLASRKWCVAQLKVYNRVFSLAELQSALEKRGKGTDPPIGLEQEPHR